MHAGAAPPTPPVPVKSPQRAAFGDFQTPAGLAAEVCALVKQRMGSPRSLIEPTCGVGQFLVAGFQTFDPPPRLIGVELNASYLAQAEGALHAAGSRDHTLIHEDFFRCNWPAQVAPLPTPLLVIGNPPWVTNAELGSLGSANRPTRSNRRGLVGLDALTGKSNFDISEWMGIRLLETLATRRAAVALLLKTTVARKLLAHAWAQGLTLREPAMFAIDAKTHFGASVDACLLVAHTDAGGSRQCAVYPSLRATSPIQTIGYDDGRLVADIHARRRTTHLSAGREDALGWRSGIKHDCAKVLELRKVDGHLENGWGERVQLDESVLFPLLKSSDVAHGRTPGHRWLIVTQRGVGHSTEGLQQSAPQTWAYLMRHRAALDARKSRIYRDRPRFAIFGVGPYAFTSWKVAISGLYKSLDFRIVGPHSDGRPVVFDDTVYFMPCVDQDQARTTHALLQSELARTFFSSLIFWDAKRPITASVLRRLSLERLTQAAARWPVGHPHAIPGLNRRLDDPNR